MLQASERPNIYCETLGPDQFGIIEKPLTLAEQIYNKVWLRKIAILVVLALAWELYGRWLDNPLLVPPFSAAMRALFTDVVNGTIPQRALELDPGAADRLCHRHRARRAADGVRHLQQDRHRFPRHHDRDVQSAARRSRCCRWR